MGGCSQPRATVFANIDLDVAVNKAVDLTYKVVRCLVTAVGFGLPMIKLNLITHMYQKMNIGC